MADKDKLSFIDQELAERKKEHKFRFLSTYRPSMSHPARIMKEGKELINFCSNDYLGLSVHPKLIKRSQQYTQKYGSGSTASRLVSGTYDIHHKLEAKLAATFGTEAALVFNSGFQANSTIISTLTDRNSLVLADRLSHNSLLQGALLSRATLKRFDHNDSNHLNQLLDSELSQSYNKILIITETVFSMDGDRAEIKEIAQIAGRHNALLFVDDAHAVGVWGKQGLGLAQNIAGIDILLGTCGKAFGTFGAYVACSKKMRDYLINFCPGFIYTTALPPPIIGATDAALDLIPKMDKERSELHKNITHIRQGIHKLGYETGLSTTQIIPIVIGDEKQTLDLADWLQKNGILATAIRPPTVPEHSSRIRITLSSAHTAKDTDTFLKALEAWHYE